MPPKYMHSNAIIVATYLGRIKADTNSMKIGNTIKRALFGGEKVDY
jgi:hypothetical protein